MRIEVAGENALILYLGEHGEQGVADRVEQASRLLKQELGEKLIDLVQQLGRKTLESWASKREEQVVQQARREGQRMQQREKKDSTGGARSD